MARPLRQRVHSPPPQQWHLTMAPSNGTLSDGTANVCTHPPPAMASSNGTTSSLSKCVITTPRLLHPAMAASNGALSNGIQQWHLTTCYPTMTSSNGTCLSNGTPYHGTQQWHQVQSVKVCPSNGTLEWHLTITPYHMAPSNGTTPNPPTCAPTQWHPAMAPYNPAVAPRPVWVGAHVGGLDVVPLLAMW